MVLSVRLRAVLQALLVTFLWSTSWILIKSALHEIPPLTFAGLRYALACAFLLPGLWRRREEVRALTPRAWGQMVALGLVFYALTQGGQFLTLKYLEAITFSLLLNFTPVLVAGFGIVVLRERPSRRQGAGIALFLGGVLLYFWPLTPPVGGSLGLALACVTVCANAAAAVLGRSVNRQGAISPPVVTAVSMGVGACLLLGSGLALQGLPPISPMGWLIVTWLALVNTALAFTLWNASLRVLSAVESSAINNLMLVQIALLAWIFLGEPISPRGAMGLLLATAGIWMAQAR